MKITNSCIKQGGRCCPSATLRQSTNISSLFCFHYIFSKADLIAAASHTNLPSSDRQATEALLTAAGTMNGSRAHGMSVCRPNISSIPPNQADKIREYAERRGIAIVNTYADEGNLTRSRWISKTPATWFTAGRNFPCTTPTITPTSNSVRAGVTSPMRRLRPKFARCTTLC